MEFYSELGDQKIPGAGKLFNYFKLKNEPNNIQENPQNEFKINNLKMGYVVVLYS